MIQKEKFKKTINNDTNEPPKSSTKTLGKLSNENMSKKINLDVSIKKERSNKMEKMIEKTVPESDNLPTITKKTQSNLNMNEAKKELEFLETKLLQIDYMNAKLENNFEKQEQDAQMQIKKVWNEVERLERECLQLQEEIEQIKLSESISEQIQNYSKIVFPFLDSIDLFYSDYDKMANDIYSITNRMPIKNGEVDVPKMVNSLERTEGIMSELDYFTSSFEMVILHFPFFII